MRGGLTLAPVEADLGEYLARYHEQRRPGVSAGLRELHLENEVGARRACFDPLRLRTVLDALVDNAVRFTPQGTNVRLELSDHLEGQEAWLRIGVRDDGYGIPSDRLPALFQTFRQGDGSMTREVGGLGMGLPNAQKLVEAMGGRLTVASEPGRGTLFSVLLRAA
jgi:signal transduction histidine kinase